MNKKKNTIVGKNIIIRIYCHSILGLHPVGNFYGDTSSHLIDSGRQSTQ